MESPESRHGGNAAGRMHVMPLIELGRYYPATVDDTYWALEVAVRNLAKLRSSDDFSKSVSFATRATGWASGANVVAYIVPQGDGAMVRVEGQAKMRTQVNANNAAHKQCVAILDTVSRLLDELTTGDGETSP